jgi:hypothetical protein
VDTISLTQLPGKVSVKRAASIIVLPWSSTVVMVRTKQEASTALAFLSTIAQELAMVGLASAHSLSVCALVMKIKMLIWFAIRTAEATHLR